MRAVIYETTGEIRDTDLLSFQHLQELVGGYVQVIEINGTPHAVHEEGRLIGLQASPHSIFRDTFLYGTLVGPVVRLPLNWEHMPYHTDH